MALRFRGYFWEQNVFCSCLPVRIGASILTLLGIVFGAILSAVLWFEIARKYHPTYTCTISHYKFTRFIVGTPGMTGADRAAFVFAGLMETVFFVLSILGYGRNNDKARV